MNFIAPQFWIDTICRRVVHTSSNIRCYTDQDISSGIMKLVDLLKLEIKYIWLSRLHDHKSFLHTPNIYKWRIQWAKIKLQKNLSWQKHTWMTPGMFHTKIKHVSKSSSITCFAVNDFNYYWNWHSFTSEPHRIRIDRFVLITSCFWWQIITTIWIKLVCILSSLHRSTPSNRRNITKRKRGGREMERERERVRVMKYL